MIDLLITNGTVITMDPLRRVIDKGAVAIKGHLIVDVGDAAELAETYDAQRVIDASRKVIMPGLIDGHAHAGHGLIKRCNRRSPAECCPRRRGPHVAAPATSFIAG